MSAEQDANERLNQAGSDIISQLSEDELWKLQDGLVDVYNSPTTHSIRKWCAGRLAVSIAKELRFRVGSLQYSRTVVNKVKHKLHEHGLRQLISETHKLALARPENRVELEHDLQALEEALADISRKHVIQFSVN
jgi:hypothetical protein